MNIKKLQAMWPRTTWGRVVASVTIAAIVFFLGPYLLAIGLLVVLVYGGRALIARLRRPSAPGLTRSRFSPAWWFGIAWKSGLALIVLFIGIIILAAIGRGHRQRLEQELSSIREQRHDLTVNAGRNILRSSVKAFGEGASGDVRAVTDTAVESYDKAIEISKQDKALQRREDELKAKLNR